MSTSIFRSGAALAAVVGVGSVVIACSSSSTTTDTNDSGPSGPPACTSSGKNAWDTYGEKAFLAVNDAIFAKVTDEIQKNGTKNLGTSFTLIGTGKPPATSDKLPVFQARLAAFLVYAYGGPSSIKYTDGKTYSGKIDIAGAHTGLNITMDQYDYFVMNIVVPALTESGVPMSDVSSCFAPVVTAPSFVADVVGR